MRLPHNQAENLERLVRKSLHCNQLDFGEIVDAGYFEKHPFDAALLVLMPIWKRTHHHEIDAFLLKWEPIIHNDVTTPDTITYIDELSNLINMLDEKNN